MNMKRNNFSRRTFLKAGVAGAATISVPNLSWGQTPPTIKVGVLQPVTGTFSMDGGYGRTGAEFGIAHINANGGIKALGGAKLEMVFADARSNPEAAVQEVEQLKAHGVAAIVGGFSSPICLAASQAASRYNLPFIVDVGVSEQIVTRGLKNTFRFSPGFEICTKTAIDNLVTLNNAAGRPAKTIVLVHEDGLYGTGLAKLMAQELPKHGFEILDTISHPTPARDMSNVALRIRSLRPDLIVPSSYYAETVLLMRTLQQQRVRVKGVYSVLNGAASNLRFIDEFPQAAENIMDCNHWHDPRKQLALDFRKQVDVSKKGWNYNVPLNFSAIQLLADAIERAASVDPGALNEALASSTFEGHIMPYGPTRFENGQNTGAMPVVLQVQQSDIKVVYPHEFSDAKPNYPLPT